MKEQLNALWAKVVANKHIVIPVVTGVVCAAIGAAVATGIANAREDMFLSVYEEDVPMDETVTE